MIKSYIFVKNNQLFYFILYVFIFIYSLNLSHWWSIWVLLEIINWYLIINNRNNSFNLYYMIYQSITILGFIYVVLFYQNTALLIMFLIFKIALPPFHFWFLARFHEWSWKSLNLFFFVHKYTPTLILLNYMRETLLYWILVLPIFRILTTYNNFGIKYLIYSIILVETAGFILSGLYSFKLFLMYIVFNLVVIVIYTQLYNYNNTNKYFIKFQEGVLLTIILRVPPLIRFNMKWLVRRFISPTIMVVFLIFNLRVYFLVWEIYTSRFSYKQIIVLNTGKILYLGLMSQLAWITYFYNEP